MDSAQPEGGPTIGTRGQAKRTGVGKQEGSLKRRESAPATQELSRKTRTQANHMEPIKI